MKIAILGFDREGKSTLKFISRQPKYRGAEIWVLDKKEVEVPHVVKSRLGTDYLSGLEGFDTIFRTPGAPYALPEIQSAAKHGVKVSSLTKLFFEEAGKKGARILGVTGTKGKGTTSTLLYNILKTGKKDVFLAGNIGTPALETLSKLEKGSLVVLELSSFQLQDLDTSPQIAVVLETFPDHQDAHKSLKEYYAAKANIARHQKRGDMIFFFKDNRMSQWIGIQSKGKRVAVDPEKNSLFREGELKLRGGHNFRNATMAAIVARALGIPQAIITRTIKQFGGVEHRLEFVRKIGSVTFYNDSASTNPHTSAAAVRAFPHEAKILIAGGQDKKLDYAPLAKALKAENVKLVILFGENKEKIERAIKKSAPIALVKTLKDALRLAQNTLQAGVIIFSPGAASFDMFKNYADRGEKFKKIVLGLTKI